MNKNKNLQNSEVFILQNMASSWKIKTILNMQYLCWKKNEKALYCNLSDGNLEKF